MQTLSEQELLEYIELNFDTKRIEKDGVFVRTTQLCHKAQPGDVAGIKTTKGYLKVTLKGGAYLAHRLVYLWVHKRFPTNQTDHINGIKLDNRPCNLRDVTNSENQRNRRMKRSNTSGTTGVAFNKVSGTWKVDVVGFNSKRHGKTFKVKADAVAHAKELHLKFGYTEQHGIAK